MLSVSNINLNKGDRQIISGVTFEVADGEIFGILGANGAGKSSLAFALMGSPDYQPDHGTISFDGIDITHMPMDERARMGITLAWQEPARFEGIPVPDFVLLGSGVSTGCGDNAGRRGARKANGQADTARDSIAPGVALADRCLEQLRLIPSEYNHRFVDRTLSGGERKKVELASVLAMRPRLAILDEPDSGIDMISQEAVISMINEIRDYGGSVILITHEEEVVKIADRAALMCSGLAFKTGGTREIVEYYRGRCAPCISKSYPSVEDKTEIAAADAAGNVGEAADAASLEDAQ
ncbi:MAG: ATP-binding cassette domain-containing protein [Thermoleophilia bacterium]